MRVLADPAREAIVNIAGDMVTEAVPDIGFGSIAQAMAAQIARDQVSVSYDRGEFGFAPLLYGYNTPQALGGKVYDSKSIWTLSQERNPSKNCALLMAITAMSAIYRNHRQ